MDPVLTIVKRRKCCFCKSFKTDDLNFGPLYNLGKINAHYFCVLLSQNIKQRGDDNEGIFGFLLSDIKEELKRSKVKKCFYCRRGFATLECAVAKCRRKFHLPCGLEAGSNHHFTNKFPSFCHTHSAPQKIPKKILIEASAAQTLCCVCYDPIDFEDRNEILWAPCCVKTWYHRICVQKLALSAGYFFKCAICNDNKKFVNCVERRGVFIPKQDAAWELVPNAYEELLYRHNKCDAKKCICPKGRQGNSVNTVWEIVLCMTCGSRGIHVGCGNLKFVDPKWECPSCLMVTMKLEAAKKNEFPQQSIEGSSCCTENYERKRRRDSEDLENSVLDKRKRCRLNRIKEEEEDKEIDVEALDDKGTECGVKEKDKEDEFVDVETDVAEQFRELLTLLKPGPLSYKLKLIQKFRENLENETEADVIEISDSESEDVQVVDET